jgi:hypothetical protein
MRKNLSLATVVFLAGVIGAEAADISGKWVADVAGRNGSSQISFDLRVDGNKGLLSQKCN